MPVPGIKIIKNATPLIYLDTNALIELSKYEKGCCKDAHYDEIEKLYNVLTMLKKEKQILCVLGDQYEEMAVPYAREAARSFIFNFTDIELMAPSQVKNLQLKYAYQDFLKNASTSFLMLIILLTNLRALEIPLLYYI